jgi:hypothetical protein
MKTKIHTLFAFMLLTSMFITLKGIAQQPAYTRPENLSGQIAKASTPQPYTYKVFQAPNKMYGFDVFRNGKFIFHQPASNVPASNYHPVLAKKEDAEKAAQFSIDKIKKGQQPSALTTDEIKKIITQ